jgi:diacylglycerol kinase family enzyme
MNRTCTLIVNRLSGSYSAEKVADAVSFLQKHAIHPEVRTVDDIAEASHCAAEACREEEHPLVLVAGGDGTINGALNGLAPGTATLGVIPFGTSNVLARELGLLSRKEALERIVRGRKRAACVGVVEKEGASRYFLEMAGIGFDAFTVAGVTFLQKKKLGKLAYVFSAIRNLVDLDRELMRVCIDGEEHDCNSIIICNAAKYAGEFVLARGSDLFSPGLTAVLVKTARRRVYLKSAARLVTNCNLQCADVCVLQATELSIPGEKPIQADGDYLFRSPATIRAVPDFVELIV